MSECEFYGRCLSGAKNSCYRCMNKDLLRLPEDKVRNQRRKKAGHFNNSQIARNNPSWRNAETQGTLTVNAMPSAVEMEAKINPGSGNQTHRPGDFLDDVIFNETKERKPIITGGGKLSITIEKGWLDKAIAECKGRGKFPVVNFKLKDTDDLYSFSKFDTIAEMVQMIKYLKNELFNSREQLKITMRELQILRDTVSMQHEKESD